MFNYGPKKDMPKRPEHEPKFSIRNKADRSIILVIGIILGVAILLLVGAILLWYFGFKE